MQRILIAGGLVLLLAGLLWPLLVASGLGRLPGDIVIERPGFTIYMPLATGLLLSLLLSLVVWLLRR